MEQPMTTSPTYVDVRTPEEFAARHVPNALNVPLDSLERRLSELGPKDRPLVLYCRSGARSSVAAVILARAGFEHVTDAGSFENGMRMYERETV
jgi:phage shock protein E